MSHTPLHTGTGLAPTRLVARELRRVFENGASRPLLVRCEREAPAHGEADVVLKLRDPQVPARHPWSLCLARELVGAVLARKSGLSVPEYAIVTVNQSFVDAVYRSPEASRLQANLGPNFGTVVVSPVVEDGGRDSALWAGPMTFDAMVLNGDRKATNRNALYDGTDLYLIDHGLVAPTWQLDKDGLPDSTLFETTQISSHAGFEYLRGKHPDFDSWAGACAGSLDGVFLRWLMGEIPSGWLEQRERDRLLAFLDSRPGIARLQADSLKEVTK